MMVSTCGDRYVKRIYLIIIILQTVTRPIKARFFMKLGLKSLIFKIVLFWRKYISGRVNKVFVRYI